MRIFEDITKNFTSVGEKLWQNPYKFNILDLFQKVYLNQGGRGWLAFGDRSRIPQSFRRARIFKFSRQKRRFLQLRENRPFVFVKRLTHTQAGSLKHPF